MTDASPALDEELKDHLASELLIQQRFLTARLLSREASIHIQNARDALQAFYDLPGNSDKLKATYVVQGTLAKRSRGISSFTVDHFDEGAIVLVGQDKLQEEKKRYEPSSLSVQLYALSPSASSSKALTTTDLANFSAVPLTLFTEQRYIQAWEQADRGKALGVIYNPDVAEGDPRAVAAVQEHLEAAATQAKKAKTPSTGPSNAKATSSSSVKTEAPTKADSTAPKDIKSKTDKKPGLDWSKAKSQPAKAAATAASSKGSKSSTKAASPPKDDDADESDVGSDVEMAQIGYADSDEEPPKKPAAGASKVRRADGVPNPATGVLGSRSSEATSSKSKTKGKTDAERAEEKRKLMEMMEVEEDQDEAGEAVPDVAASATASTSLMKGDDDAQAEASGEPAKKRRKVRRQKRTVRKERGKDAKGYTVTKEVSDYESYSDWTDSEELVLGKKAGKSSSTGAAKSTKAQDNKKTAEKKTTDAAKPAAASTSDKTTTKEKSKEPSPAKDQPASTTAKAKSSGKPGGQAKLSSFFRKS